MTRRDKRNTAEGSGVPVRPSTWEKLARESFPPDVPTHADGLSVWFPPPVGRK
jgi:hypothetical protein